MIIHTQALTNEAFRQFENRPENADKRFELRGGIPFRVPLPGPLHSFILARVVNVLITYLLTHDIGFAVGDNRNFEIAPGIVYKPGASFVAKARFPKLPETFTVAPDIAIEVVSPHNTPSEISQRIETYLQHGTQRVWVIFPEERALRTYRLAPNGEIIFHRLGENDLLDGDDVLPGFSLRVGDLFPASLVEDDMSVVVG